MQLSPVFSNPTFVRMADFNSQSRHNSSLLAVSTFFMSGVAFVDARFDRCRGGASEDSADTLASRSVVRRLDTRSPVITTPPAVFTGCFTEKMDVET